MPIVFKMKLDGSEGIRYFHVSLSVFHLKQALHHAQAAIDAANPEGETKFKESLLAIVFASLCLETFANEMAEGKFSDKELEDFSRLQGKFKIRGRATSVASKLKLLFNLYWAMDLSIEQSPLKEVEELYRVRNDLVHYKFSKSAGKAYLPVGTCEVGNGQFMTTLDFGRQPTHVEPSLVEMINAHEAAKSYNAALRIIKLWNERAGAPPDSMPSFGEYLTA